MATRGRTSLKDLLAKGLLKPGAKLVWERHQPPQTIQAVITDQGNIRLESGAEFDTPSGAATGVSGVILNGWKVWTDQASGKSLAELRDALSSR